MKKWIVRIVRGVVFPLFEEYQNNTVTSYSLIEDGEKLCNIEMIPKPSSGDIISNENSSSSSEYYLFKIHQVELSETGFTGNLYGKKIKKKSKLKHEQ